MPLGEPGALAKTEEDWVKDERFRQLEKFCATGKSRGLSQVRRVYCGKRRKRKGGKQTRMQELLTVTGLILKAEPIGEYDRRVVILTKERAR